MGAGLGWRWIVLAAALNLSLPAVAQSPEDQACADYKYLLTLTPEQVAATIGEQSGKGAMGTRYATTIRVSGYQSCSVLYQPRLGVPGYAVICEGNLGSSAIALSFVQSAKACFEKLFNVRTTEEVLVSDRYWPSVAGGTLLLAGPTTSYALIGKRIEMTVMLQFLIDPDVGLYVYYYDQ